MLNAETNFLLKLKIAKVFLKIHFVFEVRFILQCFESAFFGIVIARNFQTARVF